MPTWPQPGGSAPPTDTLRSRLNADIVANVRHFMRDYPQLNRLTKGMDHNDRHIMWAVLDTVSDWASTPPVIGVTLEMIVMRNWQSVFIRGVAISLLESLRFLHTRNYLPYSDGGITTQTENPNLISSITQLMKSEYEQKKKERLVAANIEGAYGGGVHSEYLYVNRFWGSV